METLFTKKNSKLSCSFWQGMARHMPLNLIWVLVLRFSQQTMTRSRLIILKKMLTKWELINSLICLMKRFRVYTQTMASLRNQFSSIINFSRLSLLNYQNLLTGTRTARWLSPKIREDADLAGLSQPLRLWKQHMPFDITPNLIDFQFSI